MLNFSVLFQLYWLDNFSGQLLVIWRERVDFLFPSCCYLSNGCVAGGEPHANHHHTGHLQTEKEVQRGHMTADRWACPTRERCSLGFWISWRLESSWSETKNLNSSSSSSSDNNTCFCWSHYTHLNTHTRSSHTDQWRASEVKQGGQNQNRKLENGSCSSAVCQHFKASTRLNTVKTMEPFDN